MLALGAYAAAPGAVRAQGADSLPPGVGPGDTVPAPRPSLFDGGRRQGVTTRVGFAAEERPPLRPVSRADVFGAPFLAPERKLGRRGEVLGPVTAGDRPVRAWHARVGDRVRVRVRGLPVEAGDTLHAVRIGRSLGPGRRVVEPLALLAVVRAEGARAVARVTDVFGLVGAGSPVVRIPPPAAPDEVRFVPAEREVGARVLGVAGGGLLRGGRLVFLDAGRSAGVRPGDVFLAGEPAPGEGRARGAAGGTVMIVVRVRQGTSTARVIDAGDGSVQAGARARLARRLAPSGR